MADYQLIIPIILKHEGGLTDDPVDRGGITNYGISLKFAQGTQDYELLDIDRDGDIDREDIKKLTKEQAIEVYKKHFWNPFKLDDEPSNSVALLIFDSAVNHGIGGASNLIQKTLVDMGYNISIDGKVGPKTLAALHNADSDEFINMFLSVRERYYRRIVEKNPSQNRFLRGWLNRIKSLRSAVTQL